MVLVHLRNRACGERISASQLLCEPSSMQRCTLPVRALLPGVEIPARGGEQITLEHLATQKKVDAAKSGVREAVSGFMPLYSKIAKHSPLSLKIVLSGKSCTVPFIRRYKQH